MDSAGKPIQAHLVNGKLDLGRMIATVDIPWEDTRVYLFDHGLVEEVPEFHFNGGMPLVRVVITEAPEDVDVRGTAYYDQTDLDYDLSPDIYEWVNRRGDQNSDFRLCSRRMIDENEKLRFDREWQQQLPWQVQPNVGEEDVYNELQILSDECDESKILPSWTNFHECLHNMSACQIVC